MCNPFFFFLPIDCEMTAPRPVSIGMQPKMRFFRRSLLHRPFRREALAR